MGLQVLGPFIPLLVRDVSGFIFYILLCAAQNSVNTWRKLELITRLRGRHFRAALVKFLINAG